MECSCLLGPVDFKKATHIGTYDGHRYTCELDVAIRANLLHANGNLVAVHKSERFIAEREQDIKPLNMFIVRNMADLRYILDAHEGTQMQFYVLGHNKENK